MIAKRSCIVCGRPIQKLTVEYRVQPSNVTGFASDTNVYANLRTKADCRPHTNLPHIVHIDRWGGEFIRIFSAWDGESFRSDFFCTNRCAIAQGHASARAGRRYTWSTKS